MGHSYRYLILPTSSPNDVHNISTGNFRFNTRVQCLGVFVQKRGKLIVDRGNEFESEIGVARQIGVKLPFTI
ncbi:MAG: hypothetical protein ACXAD7_16160 [Candidatus Kariarchaeaceae archaeon]